MIIKNSDFCKDFDNSFTLYKDFLNQSNSTASDTGRVQEVSSGRRGGSGGKDVEYRYYTKDKYRNLSRENNGKLKKIREKRGSKPGGGGSSEPKYKIRKLANQSKKDICAIKEITAKLGEINDGINYEYEESEEEVGKSEQPCN